MPFYIVSRDGVTYAVQTRVGDGLAVVELRPVQPREPVALEPQDGEL